MAVYEYNGKVYDLPNGLSNDEALTKIRTSLGEDVSTPIPGSQTEQMAQSVVQSGKKAGSFVEDVIRGAADTMTFGTANKMAAKVDEMQGKGTYEEALAAQQQRDAEAGSGRLVGQIGGAFANPLARPIAAVSTRVAPALRVTPEVVNPTIQGALYGAGSADQNQGTAAAFGAATGLATGAAFNIGGKVAESVFRTRAAKDLPTPQAVRDKAGAIYDQANSLGVTLQPTAITGGLADLRAALAKEGVTPTSAAADDKEAMALIGKLETMATNQPVTWQVAEKMRSVAAGVARDKNSSDTLKRLAGQVVEKIDDTVANLKPTDFVKGAADAGQAMKLTTEARQAWKQSRKADIFENILTKAETTAGQPGRSEAREIQTKLTSLINSKEFNLFSKPEQEMIKAAQKSSTTDKIASMLSNLQIGKSMFIGGGATATTAFVGSPMLAAGLQAAAYGAGGARNIAKRSEVTNLSKEIASGTRYSPKINTDLMNYIAGAGGLMTAPGGLR
jgi:hypothetical protein